MATELPALLKAAGGTELLRRRHCEQRALMIDPQVSSIRMAVMRLRVLRAKFMFL